MTPGPARGRGRPAGSRAGDSGTRERILAAAREVFAERGYDKASIRAIAQAAGVDAALVHHYFGAKEQVFEAAVELSFAPALEIPGLIADATAHPPPAPANPAGREGPPGRPDPSELGEHLARYFLGVWENPATRAPLLAVLRSAVTNETAAGVLRAFVLRRLLARVIGELDQPDAALRVQLAASQMLGLAMTRYVLKIEPIASAPVEDVVARVAPALQHHLTGPSPSQALTGPPGGSTSRTRRPIPGPGGVPSAGSRRPVLDVGSLRSVELPCPS